MKKRGQFYLLAAFIIVIILFGTAAITNRSSKKEYSVVYDLSKEIDLEGALLKEYGVVSRNSISETFENFLTRYSEYVSDPTVEMYFIYGDSSSIFLTAKSSLGSISSGDTNIEIEGVTKKEITTTNKNGGKITLDFGNGKKEFSKNFDVEEGEYFYYVFTQETTDGEIHTVTS